MASSSRSSRTQAERVAETKGRVLHAAAELLREKGYADFRVEEVARKARVSRGAQTHHFPTKDSLVLATVEDIFMRSAEATDRRIATLEPGSSVIDAVIDDAAEWYLGRYFLVALNLISVTDHSAPFVQSILTSWRKYRARTERLWLSLLVMGGIPNERARDALTTAFDLIRGMSVRRFVEDTDAERAQRLTAVRVLVAFVLEGRHIPAALATATPDGGAKTPRRARRLIPK